jgi:hypothetical protein
MYPSGLEVDDGGDDVWWIVLPFFPLSSLSFSGCLGMVQSVCFLLSTSFCRSVHVRVEAVGHESVVYKIPPLGGQSSTSTSSRVPYQRTAQISPSITSIGGNFVLSTPLHQFQGRPCL